MLGSEVVVSTGTVVSNTLVDGLSDDVGNTTDVVVTLTKIGAQWQQIPEK